MIATVDVAELGLPGTMKTLLRRPSPRDVPGLRWAEVAVLAPLATIRPPNPGRAALLAFWDDEAAAAGFAATHVVARRFAGGFHATLRPLRAFGSWPGLPADLTARRSVPHDGPVVVLTLARLRLSQITRFLRTSRPAEKSAKTADGLIWGTAGARPPFLATITIWQSSDATSAYAYARERPEHDDAIAEQRRKDFHRQSAFVRFAPLHVEGAMSGPNPVSAQAIDIRAQRG